MQVEEQTIDRSSMAAPREIDRRVVVHPSMCETFAQHRLATPEAFLNLPGEIVSGHPLRHVVQVVLPDGRHAYLKREHRVRWKDRFRNWRAGHGWVSRSVREGLMLQALEEAGYPCPKWLAFGEDRRGRAFLMIEEIAGASDLRRVLSDIDDSCSLAIRLGRLSAQLHEAGIDHPDLYAKHILVEPRTEEITILDWQRATIGKQVNWPQRIRGLAALRATIPPRWNQHWGTQFLWAYRRVVADAHNVTAPSQMELAALIERESSRLVKRRGVRDQHQKPLQQEQRLIWLDGEALCAIPEIAADLDPVRVRPMLYDPINNGTLFMLGEDRPARLFVQEHQCWAARVWAWVKGKSWRSPELGHMRLWMHLERHHIPIPRLYAFGQRIDGLRAMGFLLIEDLGHMQPFARALSGRTAPERRYLIEQCIDLMGKLHEAACQLESVETLAVREVDGSPSVIVAHPQRLKFHKQLSPAARQTDRVRVMRSIKDLGHGVEQNTLVEMSR